MRTLTLTLALFGAALSAANAQQFLLQAGSGATLVGDTFFVQPGQNFTVRTILDMQGTTASVFVVNTALAFSVSGASNNKLSYLSGVDNAGFRTLLPRIIGSFTFQIRGAAPTNPGNYSTAPGQLPTVLFSIYGVSGTTEAQLSGSYIVSDVTFSNALVAGEIYGDAPNETGLFLASQTSQAASPSLGASGYSGRRFGSPKYKVQAVPEPATITCIAFGVAALLRRRKGA